LPTVQLRSGQTLETKAFDEKLKTFFFLSADESRQRWSVATHNRAPHN
jgi:hypothetical protein